MPGQYVFNVEMRTGRGSHFRRAHHASFENLRDAMAEAANANLQKFTPGKFIVVRSWQDRPA